MALARLFVRLPWSNPAWRLNLLSAVMAAATAAVCAIVLLRQYRSTLVAAATALSLAFAPFFFNHTPTTEVYTTAAFFASLTVALSCKPPRTWRGALLGGLVWGLGLAVHPTLIFLAPLWWGTLPRLLPALAGGIGLGMLPYALLSLTVAGPQPWGDLRTLAGWWEYVTARLYWGYAFALPPAELPGRVLAWAALLARQFTPVGALLLGVGIHVSWTRQRSLILCTGLTFLMVSGYAIGYNTTDSLVYLAPFLVLLALWLAEGLVWLGGQPWLPHARWWGLALPLAALLLYWGALDLRQDVTARAWWEATLAQTPTDAVLITEEDAHTFALWYAQEALNLRADVAVVDRDLWSVRASYWDYLSLRGVQLPEGAPGRPLCALVSSGPAPVVISCREGGVEE